MWFKNLQLYRLPFGYALTAALLEKYLLPQQFAPCASFDLQSSGWVPPREGGPLVHTVDQQMLITLKTESKLLPSSVIAQAAELKAVDIEEAQGFRPGRKQMKEIKEQVADDLLPRAFSVSRLTNVWLDVVHGWLVIDTASPAKADQVVKLLVRAVDAFPLQGLGVRKPPILAMTEWLSTDEAPDGFTIDQDTELRQVGEGRGTVRYLRQSLEAEDVQRHIGGGKQCTRLGMTWRDRISFVMTESLVLKRVAPLDVVTQSASDRATNAIEVFDSDFALMAGELALMLKDIVGALGGESDDQADLVQNSSLHDDVAQVLNRLGTIAARDGVTMTVLDNKGNAFAEIGGRA